MGDQSFVSKKKNLLIVLLGIIFVIYAFIKIYSAFFDGYKTVEDYLNSNYSFKWEIVSEPGSRNMLDASKLVNKVKILSGSNKGVEFYIVDDGLYKFHLQRDTYKETIKIKKLVKLFKKEHGDQLKDKGVELTGFIYEPELSGNVQREGVTLKVANSNFIKLDDNSIKNIWDAFNIYIKFAEKNNFQYDGIYATSVGNGDTIYLSNRKDGFNQSITKIPKTYEEFVNTIIATSLTVKVRIEREWNAEHPNARANLVEELVKRGYRQFKDKPIVNNLGNPQGVDICVEGPYGEKEVTDLINYLSGFEAPVNFLQINAPNHVESEFNFYFNKIFDKSNKMTKEGTKYIQNELEKE
ncbi:MAG: hypothetical protein K0R71_2184 [Bacillales bacterium]|nr:hypothetical protein [Bacillales bacterium]